MSLLKYFVGNKKTWNSAHVALSALIYLHCNSSTVFNGWFSWKRLVAQIKATFLTLCTAKVFGCCLFVAFCFPNQDRYHSKTHEILLRGWSRCSAPCSHLSLLSQILGRAPGAAFGRGRLLVPAPLGSWLRFLQLSPHHHSQLETQSQGWLPGTTVSWWHVHGKHKVTPRGFVLEQRARAARRCQPGGKGQQPGVHHAVLTSELPRGASLRYFP